LKDEAKQFDDPFAEDRVTLLDLGDQIKSAMDDVRENALNGNQNGTQDGLKKVQEGIKELVDQLKEELAHTTDPEKKKKLQTQITELERLIPLYTDAATKLSKNPNDKSLQDLMNKLDDQLRNAVDNSVAPPSSNTAKEMSKNVDELLNAAKKGDQNGTDRLNDKNCKRFSRIERSNCE